MSWRSLSATNDTHRNSKLSAKKVIVKNIVISQETTMGSMDVSNLEYTRDDYSGNILTIEETLRGPDISLNRIKVLNQSDTSGVVKFVKPFVAPSAGLEGLRAYDGSFTTTNVLRDFQVGSVTKRDGDIIEILNDASFSNHITAPDVCANVIGSRNPTNGLPIYLSADVSINGGLQCSDISVSHIHPLDAATKLLVNNDISASGAIYASDLSGFTFRAVDVSVNDMYGANGHIDVVADISVNGVIQVTEISMNMLGGHNNRITIHNDLSVNGDLIVGEDLTLSNLFTTSDYIHFHNVTDISNDIKNLDISVGEIFPKELGNERFVKRESIEKETLIINGDVSFSGRVEADWVESEFNVLDRVDTLATLISNSAKYPIGALIQVKRENSYQIDIFIKTNKDAWYKLKSTNATPLFTIFTLSYEGSALSGDIANTNPDEANYFYYPTSLNYPYVSVGLQKYEEVGGFGGFDEVVFYVKKIKDEENNVYFFDISGTDSEANDITFSLIGDKTFSDFSYLNGAGWGLSSVNSVENDISRIRIEVPINNGFDVSFVLKADDKFSTFNEKIITIKKFNEAPVWKHMVLEASNSELISSGLSSYYEDAIQYLSDSSFNTKEWYLIHDPNYVYYTINLPIDYSGNLDLTHTFNVRYYKPQMFNGDVSYFIIDLSSEDPEGFDVSYIIKDVHTQSYYDTTDWSYYSQNNKVYVKVPGEGYSGTDFSLEIMSHDNQMKDVSNLIYNNYYSDFYKNIIVTFHKDIDIFDIISVSNNNDPVNLIPTPEISFNFENNSYKLYFNLYNDNEIQSTNVSSVSNAITSGIPDNYNSYLNINSIVAATNMTSESNEKWYIELNKPTYIDFSGTNYSSYNDYTAIDSATLKNEIDIEITLNIQFNTTVGLFKYVDLKSVIDSTITLKKSNSLRLKVIDLDDDSTRQRLANSTFSGFQYGDNNQWYDANNSDGQSVRELSRYDEIDSITYMSLGNIQYSLKNDNNELSHVYIHINLNNQGGGGGGSNGGCGYTVNMAGAPGGIAAFSAVNVKCYINSSYNIKIVNGVSKGGTRNSANQNIDPDPSYIQWFLYDGGQLYEYKISVVGGNHTQSQYGEIKIERQSAGTDTWTQIFYHNKGTTGTENVDVDALEAMFDVDGIAYSSKFCYFGSKKIYSGDERRLGSRGFGVASNIARSGGWTWDKLRPTGYNSSGGNTNMHSFHYYPPVEPGLSSYWNDIFIPYDGRSMCDVKGSVGLVFTDSATFSSLSNAKHLGRWFDYVTKPTESTSSTTTNIFRYLQSPNQNSRIYKPFPGKGGVGAGVQGCEGNQDWNNGGYWGYPRYVNGWHWRADWLSNALYMWGKDTGDGGYGWNKNTVFYYDYPSGTRDSNFNYPRKGDGGGGSAMSYIRITEYKILNAQFTQGGKGDWNT